VRLEVSTGARVAISASANRTDTAERSSNNRAAVIYSNHPASIVFCIRPIFPSSSRNAAAFVACAPFLTGSEAQWAKHDRKRRHSHAATKEHEQKKSLAVQRLVGEVDDVNLRGGLL
jgi:hypothetical protein